MKHGSSLSAVVAFVACLAGVECAAAGPADWTGFYLGVAAGGHWTDATWTATQLADPPSSSAGTGTIDASSPDRFTPTALRAGLFAGYNFQTDRWVYGVEADLGWADKTDSHSGLPGCRILCFPGAPGPGNDLASVRTTWDASLRARLGYLVMPNTLIYGTGGIAWQGAEISGTCENSLADPVCLVSAPFAVKTQTDRTTLTGWTLGIGLEQRFGAWLVRGEYRYARFGTVNGVFWAGQPVADPGSDAYHYEVAVHTHTAQVGVAYKF